MTQMEKLKVLLGLTEELDENQALILQFVLDETADFICRYCRVREVPAGLENTLLAMAADGYRAQAFGEELSWGNVKSVTEGQVSVTFDGTTLPSVQKKAAWDAYAEQLNAFRKVGWRCEVS